MSNVITFEEFEEMYKKHRPSDNLTLLDILEIIKYSVDYIEFMITYNELIPDIVKAKKEAEVSARIYFMKEKNRLRTDFYDKFCVDNPDKTKREYQITKHVYLNPKKVN